MLHKPGGFGLLHAWPLQLGSRDKGGGGGKAFVFLFVTCATFLRVSHRRLPCCCMSSWNRVAQQTCFLTNMCGAGDVIFWPWLDHPPVHQLSNEQCAALQEVAVLQSLEALILVS